jgi:hypothetical protein
MMSNRHENKKQNLIILESVFCLPGIQCFQALAGYRAKLGMTTLS